VVALIMRFLIDQNVPMSVGAFLAARGHEVLYSREVVGRMSPDQLIAFAAETRGLIVVTHDRDFRRYREMLAGGFQRRFEQGAGRISLSVRENRAVARLSEEIETIEFQYERTQREGRRLLLEITETTINFVSHGRRN
jgi:EAL domain-containing protein (putative c-di-GMP-specific phosphodiesterase class I)